MKNTLNPNEWIVIEALWEQSPATLGETIERTGTRASWNYKTYQSYVNVLEKKDTSLPKNGGGTNSTLLPYPVKSALSGRAKHFWTGWNPAR